jgi:hypothetical protein
MQLNDYIVKLTETFVTERHYTEGYYDHILASQGQKGRPY